MKASEILRKLADVIDSQDTAEVGTGDHNRNTLKPVEVDNVDHAEGSVFVPPLQQKIELLKKATGVESIYDEPEDHGASEDEIAAMKRNAGIRPVVIQVASDDEPLDM